MKFTRLPLLLAALSVSALPTLAQQTASHTYTTVDAYGNVKTETVQTPLANASSPTALIAQQGVLGANTTSSTVTYGRGDAYCPPTYPVPVPVYGNPYPYPYPVVNNNYYYPQQPYSMPLGPIRNGSAPWITSIPLGTTYYNGVPCLPGQGGYGYYNGIGAGSIITSTKIKTGSIEVGNGGIRGRYEGRNNTTSTVILPGHSNYITSNQSRGYRR